MANNEKLEKYKELADSFNNEDTEISFKNKMKNNLSKIQYLIDCGATIILIVKRLELFGYKVEYKNFQRTLYEINKKSPKSATKPKINTQGEKFKEETTIEDEPEENTESEKLTEKQKRERYASRYTDKPSGLLKKLLEEK